MWHGKAAEQGNSNSQYSYGWCYEMGKGVEQDDAKALKWFQKAAEQGQTDALYHLGTRL